MPQFPAERFRAGAQFFVHTAAAGRFALQRTQSIRGKSRYKRFQRGYISRRLKESTGLRRFLRHEALHGGDQIRGRDECPAVQEGAFFEAGQAPDFGEVDRVERVCPRSGDVEALPGGCLLYTSPSPRDA